ncbi:methyltransferase domain-containing protein [Argonema galeatum A003/A1]|nr:methyltransferase domain-containing protein [Argonema galeatum A003/A1]
MTKNGKLVNNFSSIRFANRKPEIYIMDEQALNSLEKIRQQFDVAPYPRIPLEDYPNDMKYLTLYNIVTAYYLRYKKVVETQERVILDAGCGSGFKSLALAVANPGAKIVGIDLSEESVKLAKERLKYHGIKNVDFYPLSIYDLPKLGIEFHYIHCDDTLYLLPDIVTGLQAMKSVLKAEGIIRANLHSLRARIDVFAAQEMFRLMGLMDENPQELEIELVRETMKALKDNVLLKANTWRPEFDRNEERILMNYLFQGDRGYTIPEMFSALKAADLEFVSMVNWPQWDLMDLFKEPDDLPMFLGISLPNLTVEERLHLFELLHPIHRLLDFWCAHPNTSAPPSPVAEWTDEDWRGVQVYMHPSLRVPEVKQQMYACAIDLKMFEIGRYLAFAKDPTLLIDSTLTAMLLPLLEETQSIPSLVQNWLQVRPLHPVTLDPIHEQAAFQSVKQLLISLEQIGFVLLEQVSSQN